MFGVLEVMPQDLILILANQVIIGVLNIILSCLSRSSTWFTRFPSSFCSRSSTPLSSSLTCASGPLQSSPFKDYGTTGWESLISPLISFSWLWYGLGSGLIKGHPMRLQRGPMNMKCVQGSWLLKRKRNFKSKSRNQRFPLFTIIKIKE